MKRSLRRCGNARKMSVAHIEKADPEVAHHFQGIGCPKKKWKRDLTNEMKLTIPS